MEATGLGAGANKRQRCKRCRWTREEDELLIELVKRNGTWNWSSIADHIAGRTRMSCRLRWVNHLNPKVDKMQFSKEECGRLSQLHRVYGNKWATIASFFPGRTDNQLKNQYHILVTRRIAKVPDPSSSTSHQLRVNRGSTDLSGGVSLSGHSLSGQFSGVVQPRNNSSVCVPYWSCMNGKIKTPLLCSGCTSTCGKDDSQFVDHFLNQSGKNACPCEHIDGNVYASHGGSHEYSLISNARFAGFFNRFSVPQPPQGACVEKTQFIDFLGVGDSE